MKSEEITLRIGKFPWIKKQTTVLLSSQTDRMKHILKNKGKKWKPKQQQFSLACEPCRLHDTEKLVKSPPEEDTNTLRTNQEFHSLPSNVCLNFSVVYIQV